MTISYSSRIATRGLTFAADAANPASLPTNVSRNLIAQPENLSNVLWSKSAIDVALSTSTTAPDGASTVYSVTEQANSAQHLLSYSLGTVVINDTFVWSGYFKNNTNTTQIVLHTNGEGTVIFNISGVSAGTVASVNGAGSLSGAILDAGNGWYRCSAVFKKANTTGTFYVSNQNGLGVYTGATNISYFAWGLQLEYNTAVTPYYSATQSSPNTRWYDTTNTSRSIPLSNLLTSAEYLIVGGGGGGGKTNGDNGGGGGGAGGVLSGTTAIVPQTYIVTVGAGGITLRDATNDVSAVGGNSSFGSLVAAGGGYGGGYINGDTIARFAGYFGGSSGGSSVSTPPIAVTPVGQGFIGGTGVNGWGGGGGGGAGGVGGSPAALVTSVAGAGGPGILSSISGTATYYAGGGGGGGTTGRQSDLDLGGIGGIGGGGRGGSNRVNSQPGTPNTGGGGGGGGGLTPGETFASVGGSGIVIIRYLGSQQAVGGVVTSAGGYTIHTFTTSGTFTPTSPQSTNVSYGTFQNNVTYDSRNSGSLVFDNNTSYVAFPDLPSQTNSPLSVFAWVYLNATPTGTNGIWGHYGVGSTNIHFEINPTATRLRLGDTNKGDLPMLAIGSWQFVGFTSTGSSHSYYVNGVLSTTWTGTTGTVLGGSGAFPSSHMVGRSDATRVWNGRIAHVAVYTTELTAAEVLNNYNALRGRYGV